MVRRTIGVALLYALLLTGIGTGTANAASLPGATVTVDPTTPGGRLPEDFVGLSYEMRELGTGGFDAGTGNLVNLLRTLGHSSVRISGNTLDRDTLWVPAGQQPPQPLPDWVKDVVTPADITRLDGFLRATGWNAMVGINVGRWDPALGADQAHAMSSILGDRLHAAQCGNEPNSWVSKGFRTPGYGYAQYKPEWEACATVIGSNRIAGPDTSSPTSTAPFVASFAQDERDRVNTLTIHNYSVGSTATVADLLSPQTRSKQLNSVAPELASAQTQGLPIRLDETNSAAGGGVAGVSDTYASALWVMDYSLQMAQAGFAGVNLHGGLGVCGAPLYNGKFQLYTPICAADDASAQAKVYRAMPEYYGLYLAARMGPGRFLPLTLDTVHNLTAYAVRGDDGRTRIALIQKETPGGAPVRVDLRVGGGRGTAEVVRLTGGALTDADGVKIQGATVDARGRLPHRPADRVRLRDGSLTLDLAAGTAVVITLPRSACPTA